MTHASLFLVVLAAFIHAGWNLFAKRGAAAGAAFVFAYNLVACIAYAPWVAYVLADRAMAWSLAVAGALLLSGLIHLAYSLSLQRGYRVADLSVVYPVARGTGPLLSTLGAVLVLGELPTPARLAGLALVVAGIVLIATRGDLSALRQPAGRAGLRWGVATGILIAGYTVVDAYAVKQLDVSPVVLDWINNVLRFLILAPLVLAKPARARESMRGHWGAAVAVGLLSPLSYILVLGALGAGAPLSIVAPMREMSMMIGALMGMLILRETVGPWRLGGCAVLILGVILLSSG